MASLEYTELSITATAAQEGINALQKAIDISSEQMRKPQLCQTEWFKINELLRTAGQNITLTVKPLIASPVNRHPFVDFLGIIGIAIGAALIVLSILHFFIRYLFEIK